MSNGGEQNMQTGELIPASWMRQLLARLAGAEGQAAPLHTLASEFLGCTATPQHLFDGLKLLLESGQVRLDEDDGLTLLVLAATGAEPRYRQEKLSRGDLVLLAAAVAVANGYRQVQARVWPEAADRSVPPIRAKPRRRLDWSRDNLLLN
jgi:hypothetical protein